MPEWAEDWAADCPLPDGPGVPSTEEVRQRCREVFDQRACRWQVQFAQAILAQKGDVVLEVGTGMGKTLAFWLPLLFRPTGIQIVVTALNALGQQCARDLAAVNIRAVAIDGSMQPDEARSVFKEIENGEVRVLIVSPEQLMKDDGLFTRAFKKPAVQEAIFCVIFDEAHCIPTWGKFRPEYREVIRLRYRLRKEIPFALASATLPPPVRKELLEILHLRPTDLVEITRSTDRPNIHLSVRIMQHAVSSFKDLAFIIPKGSRTPPKFICFFRKIAIAADATRYLWSLVDKTHHPRPHEKIVWFSSTLSEEAKRRIVEKYLTGEIWGLCATDAFGMGMDIPDIQLVVNYEATDSNFCQVWQRFGRAARDRSIQGCAVLLVEKKYTDEVREKTAQRKEAAAQKETAAQGGAAEGSKKRKREITDVGDSERRAPLSRAAGVGLSEEERAAEGEGGAGSKEEDDARRALYAKGGTGPSKKRAVKPDATELEPALDDFVNAGTRQAVRCRRKVIHLFFNAHKTVDDHTLCDPAGCKRCAPLLPTLCCDLHGPGKDYLATLYPELDQLPPEKAKHPSRSRLRKYDQMEADRTLVQELHGWRVKKAKEVIGEGPARVYGGGSILPSSAIDRIVLAVHFNKINTVEDLLRETRWSLTAKYGTEVLAVIDSVCRQSDDSPFTTRPLAERSLNNTPSVQDPGSAGSSTVSKKTFHCGLCKAPGHNRRTCPNNINSTQTNNQNNPPNAPLVPAITAAAVAQPPVPAPVLPPPAPAPVPPPSALQLEPAGDLVGFL